MTRITEEPKREDFDGEDLKAYDVLRKWIPPVVDEQGVEDMVGSEANWFPVAALSPLVSWAQSVRRQAIADVVGNSGTYSSYEYHFTEAVVWFDTEYYDLLPFHISVGSEAGIRPEAFEAIRDKRDDLLNEPERIVVTFIRQALAGTVTDESYAAIKEILGSDRGVYEYFNLIYGVLVAGRVRQTMLSEHFVTLDDVNETIEKVKKEGPPKGSLAFYEGMTKVPSVRLRVWPVD